MNNLKKMTYLKTSLIGFTASAALIAGAALAEAQTTNWSTLTAVGSANSPVVYIPNTVGNGSQTAVTSGNAIPANYTAGYYNYPGNTTINGTNGMWVNGVWVSGSWINGVWTPSASTNSAYNYTSTYPGVPNTGGTVSTNGTLTSNTSNSTANYTSVNPATGTYVAPTVSWSGTGGLTGGISIPVGYSAAPGMNGSILTTNNWNTSTTYPGAPNTGNTGGSINSNGRSSVDGVVTIITPTALAIASGNQVWTIGWNAGTTITTSSGTTSINGAQVSIGDSVHVEGTLDPTFVSKINAVTIRDLTNH